MKTFAEFADGVKVGENVFRILARFAPGGLLDVFASDQHNSYLKLTASYLKHTGQDRKPTDEDVADVCLRFARGLGGAPTAVLFNHLAYLKPDFRQTLGERVMLIGRIEDTNTDPTPDGKGQLAKLAVEPERVAEHVDGFKTMLKLDPDHRESWTLNREWLAGVYDRTRKLGKPLFNETVLAPRGGESRRQMAERLPEALIQIAEEFSPCCDFYKTQVPFLWVDDDGRVQAASSPDVVRRVGKLMLEASPRPMLLLSAAVDFEQYAAQYALVADCFAGPMCGRAYFKEVFTAKSTRDGDSLERNFGRVALPRIDQIKALAGALSLPWWHKFSTIADEARALLKPEERLARVRVKADYGY